MSRATRSYAQAQVLFLVLFSPMLAPLSAGINGGCVDDVNESTGANCTSNDVTFTLVGLGVQQDGCVNAADTLEIFLGATVRNTTAQARYDIGMFVATDGDPNNDGAISGSCFRQSLTPASPTTFIDDGVAPTCVGTDGTPLDLLRTVSGPNAAPDSNGYYLTAESGSSSSIRDVCGDLNDGGISGCDSNGDGTWDDSFMVFTDAVSLPCDDVDSDGNSPNTSNDGYVNIPTCATWGQQANEIDDNGNGTCDGDAELENGTAAKCKCEDVNSTVPVPNLDVLCGCVVVDEGLPTARVDCTVTYANVAPLGSTCNQAGSVGETFAPFSKSCGTAGYVQFETSYPTASGDISTPTFSDVAFSTCGSGNPTGTAATGTDGVITWTPTSFGGTPTAGVVGVNECKTMNFTFTPCNVGDPGCVLSNSLTFPTTVYWSNESDFSPRDAQTSSLFTCTVPSTTPVTLAQFNAALRDERVVLTWTTTTESGNAGFNVYAETHDGTRRLNRHLIPSHKVDSLAPESYRFRVDAQGLEGAKFFVEDVALNGRTRRQGPFGLNGEQGRRVVAESLDWAAIRADIADQNRHRERQAGMRSLTAQAGTGTARRNEVELAVAVDGLHRVTYEELAAAGFDFVGARAADLTLRTGGAVVPIRVAGPAKFGPRGYFEFYGRALDTLYTSTNVYRLTVERDGARAGLDTTPPNAALPAASSYLETARFERDRAYGFGSPNGDPWYDTVFQAFAGSGASADFTLSLDHLLAGAGTASLAVELWGMTDFAVNPDHHVVLRWNGAPVADEVFDGGKVRPIAIDLPAGVLQEGANTLRVTVPADLGTEYDFLALDRFAVTYPRAFVAQGDRLSFAAAAPRFIVSGLTSPDVVVYRATGAGDLTQLAGVQVATGAGGYIASFPGSAASATYHLSTVAAMRHAALSAARDGQALLSGSADYLVISHPSFIEGVAPLVAARQSQGRTVRVVDVRDVYAAFSHGVFDAEAIRRYIAHAYRVLGARDVLLVGGDTYDYRNFLGLGAVSFVPSPYMETSPFVRFAPVDPAYADVDRDGVPDLAIGRLPVRTAAELDTIVAQTLAYEHKSYGQSAVYAADAYDPGTAISFSALSERFATSLPSQWTAQRAYIDADGLAGARSELVGAINGGVALTSFIGHSGPSVWSFQGLFNNADAAGLTNSGAPTVVSQWGCWNNYFISPQYESLAQKLLLSGDRGAAAVLGATGLTSVANDRALGELLSPRLVAQGVSLGEAVLAAKRDLARRHPEMVDVLMGWTLLGDPALAIDP